MSGNSWDETNFPLILWTNTQVSKISKAYGQGSSANMKFSKTQLSKMMQSGGFMPSIFLGSPENLIMRIVNGSLSS